jgi:hypothetical protein
MPSEKRIASVVGIVVDAFALVFTLSKTIKDHKKKYKCLDIYIDIEGERAREKRPGDKQKSDGHHLAT